MEEETKETQIKEQSSIKLNRGMKGTYGWEIKIFDDSEDNILTRIKKINKRLIDEYVQISVSREESGK